MRRLMTLTTVLVVVLVFSSAAFAQGAFRGAATSGPFDAKDLSGIWLLQRSNGTIGPTPPALTPKGEAAMKGRIPESSVAVPAFSNDPIRQCNPNGFPRI